MCTRGCTPGALLLREVASVATNKQPNRRLAAVMELASVTNKGLAARVVARGVRCDHTYVRRWLDGSRPSDDTVRCVAAVLSVKLGRVVTFEEIGFEPTQGDAGLDALHSGAHYSPDSSRAVDILEALTEADLGDGPAVTKSEWDASP